MNKNIMKLMCYIPSFLKLNKSLLDEQTIMYLFTSNFPLCHNTFHSIMIQSHFYGHFNGVLSKALPVFY